MCAWNCGTGDLSRRTNVSSTYLHQIVGMTRADLSIVSSNHSMKMLANTGESPFVTLSFAGTMVEAVSEGKDGCIHTKVHQVGNFCCVKCRSIVQRGIIDEEVH